MQKMVAPLKLVAEAAKKITNMGEKYYYFILLYKKKKKISTAYFCFDEQQNTFCNLDKIFFAGNCDATSKCIVHLFVCVWVRDSRERIHVEFHQK